MKTFRLPIVLSFAAMLAISLGTAQSAQAANGTQQQHWLFAGKSSQSQTPGEYIDDTLITTAVKTNLLEEKGLSSMQISVDTKDGVVTLLGTTDTAEHSLLAERVAKMTNGVKLVVNTLKVTNETLQTPGGYVDDAAVTTAVKTKIFEEKGLASLKISVETKNGVVVLTGTANSAENAQLAVAVAKQAHGVKQVVNNLQIVQ